MYELKYYKHIFNKKNFHRKDEEEIFSFEYPKVGLKKLDIGLNIDIEEILSILKYFNSQINSISKDFKELQSRKNK
ncbi:hypothetical protein NSA23_05385 [Anaerosalibacter massiliensis]|uniref:Uncharacterized protein n=1 Tax=Anaerosalibacter massiliensis TaxID=1347392 RepID=A0A9X2MGF3_9FIRM|nr:hypothetical protein [Anaerosalibacter massiliensis]MCR2043548.1 hypothetical protein [Anaerosalibacter massiliensis]